MKPYNSLLKLIAWGLIVLSVSLGICNWPSSAAVVLSDSTYQNSTDQNTDQNNAYQNTYQTRQIHSPDGIGKFYMGREIAQVMGYEGAAWLERTSRSNSEQPQQVLAALQLNSTDVVADIGAGTGYFTFRISSLVPEGKVFAVDVQPEMLDLINFVKTQENISNIETVLGQIDTPNLPMQKIDLALMVDAYHEFAYPREMMKNLVAALKPGGRVVLVEYRGENPLILIKGLHKMTEKQVRKEMKAVGLNWIKTDETLPQQHLIIFKK
ncbi:MAG: class I SAM-dependent methyltransferase [Microcoleaceae cyanobacterium]